VLLIDLVVWTLDVRTGTEVGRCDRDGGIIGEVGLIMMKETGVSKKLKAFRGIIQDVKKKKIPLVDIRPEGKDTLAYLVFSNGTSGLPKGPHIYDVRFIGNICELVYLFSCNDFAWIPIFCCRPVARDDSGDLRGLYQAFCRCSGNPSSLNNCTSKIGPPRQSLRKVSLSRLPSCHCGPNANSLRACLASTTLVSLPKLRLDLKLSQISLVSSPQRYFHILACTQIQGQS